MTAPYHWEESYPPSLRGYRIDTERLPAGLDVLPARAGSLHGARPAFTVVTPAGTSATLSFADVDTLSDAFAAFLVVEVGLAPGDVVAIQMPNALHYPVTAFGTWKAGAILTNINPLYTERELIAQLQDCGAKVLVATGMSPSTLAAAVAECGVYVVLASQSDLLSSAQGNPARPAPDDDGARLLPRGAPHCRFDVALSVGAGAGPVPHRRHGVALYQYTGGTTGVSKGAQLTHHNVLSAVRMVDDFMRGYGAPFRQDDVMLTVLPLYHIFAFVINFLVLFEVGARNILVPSPRPMSNLKPAFEQFSPTCITGVDTLYAGLMAEPWFSGSHAALRMAISGGTALRPSTAERWRQGVCPMIEGYGLTEASCVVTFNPPNGPVRAGSAGLPMAGLEVKVVDDDGRALPPGERGELLVRGPNIMAGYLNKPEENASALADGWFRTGDVVVIAPDGYITVVDRLKDMVLVSGFNVYPNEVEAVIASHPDVAEVAVIGVPDEGTGEAVCAYIVRRSPTLTAEEVVRHCRTQLTAYKVPRQVVFQEQLPKSPVGKILRARLRRA